VVAVGFLLFLLAALVGGAHLFRATTFSAFDESTHLDYTWKVMHGSIPFDGDKLAPYTLQQWSCHRQANQPKKAIPPCGSSAPASAYPAAGLNYNGIHPPVYYALTGVGAEAISAVTPASFFTSARIMSIIWTYLGLFASYLVLRYWRVGWPYALAGSALLITLPSVLSSVASVTNDAPALLAGAGAMYVLGRVLIYGRTGWLVPALITGAVVSMKVISGLALIAVAIVLLIVALRRGRANGFRRARPVLIVSGAMFLVIGSVYKIWAVVQAGRALPDYLSPIRNANTQPISGRLPFDDWLPTLVGGFRLGRDYYLAPPVDSAQILAWAILAGVILSSVAFVAVSKFAHGRAEWFLGVAVIVGSMIYPLIVQVNVYASSSGTRFFTAPGSRYANSLIPLAVGLAAVLASHFRLRRTAIATVALGLLIVVTSSFGIG